MYLKSPVFIGIVVLTIIVILGLTTGGTISEGFLYSSATRDGCDNICRGQSYPEYCNSRYLKGGPASPCTCTWDAASMNCINTATDPITPTTRADVSDAPSITGLYWY